MRSAPPAAGASRRLPRTCQARLRCGTGRRPRAGVVALRRPTVRSRGLPTAASTRASRLGSGRRARTWPARPRHPVPDVDGPVSPPSSVPGVDGSPAPAADSTRQRWAARNRVVIVDDHGPFRSIAGQLLTADGFVVVGEAADGAAAIRVCDAAAPRHRRVGRAATRSGRLCRRRLAHHTGRCARGGAGVQPIPGRLRIQNRGVRRPRLPGQSRTQRTRTAPPAVARAADTAKPVTARQD